MNKKVFAIEHLTTCAGCENAILDLEDSLLSMLDYIELAYAPIIMDANAPEHVDIALLTGAVRTEEDLKKVKEWRNKAKILVAFGSCACFGGIPGLANLSKAEDLLKTSYINQLGVVNPLKRPPEVDIPKLNESIKPIGEIVKIDYQIPGCPPPHKLIKFFFNAIIEGKPFELPNKSVCDECPLNAGQAKEIKCIKRWVINEADPSKCFLEQGFICLGPVTRNGCDARCIKAGYPCRGCLGPTEKYGDQAAKMISVLSSSTSLDEVSLDDLMKLLDIVGFFYRFTFPSSIIKYKAGRREV